LGSVLASAGSEVSDGAGATGDSTGITTTQSITMAGTSPGAEPFTTGIITIAVESDAGRLSVPEFEPDPSRATVRRLADTRRVAARAACVRVPLAATITAENPGAIRHAAGRASVGTPRQRLTVAELTAVAGVINDNDRVS